MPGYDKKNSMTMRYPATRWQDALPTGNGTIGALMYGAIHHDTIILNHDALFYPGPKPELQDISDQLPILRELIQKGHYHDAQNLFQSVHAQRAGDTATVRTPYQPFADIRLEHTPNGPFRHYRRGVDFDTGRIWLKWTDDAGIFSREAFVSRISDTVWLRINGSPSGQISGKICLTEHCEDPGQESKWFGMDPLKWSVLRRETTDQNMLVYSAELANQLYFGAVARVTAEDGQLHSENGTLVFENADSVIMQVKLFIDEDPKNAIPRLVDELTSQTPDFETAFETHAQEHKKLFQRVQLDLNDGPQAANEELLMAAYDGEVPTALIQKQYEFGRYLLICSSRPGSWPANLQGIWNGDFYPAWQADIHNDENIQMNYWQALPGNLPKTALPFFDYFEKWLTDYRENAQKIYGCHGIFIPVAQTIHGIETPRVWTHWTAAAGWLGQLFFDYYLFTGDRAFLRDRAIPWLNEVALFYEDFLIEDDDGQLLFSPSLSPENVPSGDGFNLITMNATMDVAVCREVLTNLCRAYQILNVESEKATRWRKLLAKLPEYTVNEDGALCEWLHPTFKDNYHHRHQSHLYPLFPGYEITAETKPELFEACRVAVEKRLVIGLTSQTGWSLAHMAHIYARLGLGNRALECLEMIARSSTGPNFFTYHNDWRDMGLTLHWDSGHPPFQIDANFGITSAVQEMLLFSNADLVKLLPALPDKWCTGSVAGFKCRCGITVYVKWDRPSATLSATLTADRATEFTIKLPDFQHSFIFSPATSAQPDKKYGAGYWKISLEKNEVLRIESPAQ